MDTSTLPGERTVLATFGHVQDLVISCDVQAVKGGSAYRYGAFKYREKPSRCEVYCYRYDNGEGVRVRVWTRDNVTVREAYLILSAVLETHGGHAR